MRCVVENKISLIAELNQLLPKYIDNVESVEYSVFRHKAHDWIQEYLIINYVGGARTVRSCNGNSFSAILQELTRYLNSGNYAEEQNLREIERDLDWVPVI